MEGESSSRGGRGLPAFPPCLRLPPLTCHSQNVLELTLYDKDLLDSDQLSLLLFDLRSLKPGQPYRHTFLLNHQVSPPASQNLCQQRTELKRGSLAQGIEVRAPGQHRPGLQDRPSSVLYHRPYNGFPSYISSLNGANM